MGYQPRRLVYILGTMRCKLSDEPDVDETTEQAYDRLAAGMLTAANLANLAIVKLTIKPRLKPVPFWNDTCTTTIRNRNYARNRAKRSQPLEDIIEYRRLKAIAQRTLKDTKKAFWQSYCTTLTTSSKLRSVWKMARKMSGTSSAYTLPILKKTDGNARQTT